MRFNLPTVKLQSLLAIGLLTLLSACGGDGDSRRFSQIVDTNKNDWQSISISPQQAVVHVKGTIQFELQGQDSEGASRDLTHKASWSVSDTRLGSISNKGLFTPTGTAGELMVNVSYANLSQSQPLSITDEDIVAVNIVTTGSNLSVCQNQNFDAEVLLASGVSVTYPVTYRLATDSPIASINRDSGLLRSFTSGEINVIAEAVNNNDQVISSSPFSLSILDNLSTLSIADQAGNQSLNVREGQSLELKVTAHYTDQSQAVITSNARLTSADANIATVNADSGVVKGVKGSYQGQEVMLSASCNNVIIEAPLQVLLADVRAIQIFNSDNQSENINLTVGNSVQFKITASFEDSAESDTDFKHNIEWGIDWNASGPLEQSHITLTNNGLLTASTNLNLTGRTPLVVVAEQLDQDGNVATNRQGQPIRDTITVTLIPNF